MQLTDRQNNLLKLVVDEYIKTAEPVGSKVLADAVDGKISSATIRNELSFLEDAGYLEKPHISAGRVPTDKAYREYVDNLMTLTPLKEAEREVINSELHAFIYDNGDILKSANSVLAEETGYIALSLTPSSNAAYVKELKILMIEPGRALVVAIISPGIVHDRIITVSDLFSESDLHRIAKRLEQRLQGVKINDISLMVFQIMQDSRNVSEGIMRQLLYEVLVTIKQTDEIELYVDGINKLVTQPEFNSVEKMVNIYNALSNNGLIANYIVDESDSGEDEAFIIRIGQEIQIDNLDSVSLISASYRFSKHMRGSIGIVGPKRMDYESILPKVTYMRYKLNNLYNNDSKLLETKENEVRM